VLGARERGGPRAAGGQRGGRGDGTRVRSALRAADASDTRRRARSHGPRAFRRGKRRARLRARLRGAPGSLALTGRSGRRARIGWAPLVAALARGRRATGTDRSDRAVSPRPRAPPGGAARRRARRSHRRSRAARVHRARRHLSEAPAPRSGLPARVVPPRPLSRTPSARGAARPSAPSTPAPKGGARGQRAARMPSRALGPNRSARIDACCSCMRRHAWRPAGTASPRCARRARGRRAAREPQSNGRARRRNSRPQCAARSGRFGHPSPRTVGAGRARSDAEGIGRACARRRRGAPGSLALTGRSGATRVESVWSSFATVSLAARPRRWAPLTP
jgi:hypothetical protein